MLALALGILPFWLPAIPQLSIVDECDKAIIWTVVDDVNPRKWLRQEVLFVRRKHGIDVPISSHSGNLVAFLPQPDGSVECQFEDMFHVPYVYPPPSVWRRIRVKEVEIKFSARDAWSYYKIWGGGLTKPPN